jgi:DNA-binding GntR family transcriptional regulator
MTRGPAPSRVRELVRAGVDSYEKLVVLEVLFRADEALAVDAVCERTGSPRSTVQEALDELWKADLVVLRAGRQYAYDHADADLDASFVALLRMFDQDPVELAHLLDRAAMERARSALHERISRGYALRRARQQDGQTELPQAAKREPPKR